MRTRIGIVMALALALVGLGPRPGPAAPPEDLNGRWKLVVLAYGADEFLVVDVATAAETLDVKVVDAQAAIIANPAVTRAERAGDTVTLGLKLAGPGDEFVGSPAPAEGGQVKAILGTLRFRDSVFPARLERTEAAKVAPLQGSGPVLQKVITAQRTADPKARVAALKGVLHDSAGYPTTYHAVSALLQAAEGAGLSEQEVRGLVEKALADAKPYGPSWTAEMRTFVLKALAGKAPFASLTLELAQEADRALGESAALEQRAAVAKILADAARAAGRDELAASAAERSRALEEQLDADYRAKVPPFQPDPIAERPDDQVRGVVLVELFTGAQCPPCVAADVAFDALGQSYRPGELVALQYHLHIPGPDPLTSPAALARQSYYDREIEGTPTTLLNGKKASGGGGPMGLAEPKYREYRAAIDARLADEASAALARHRAGQPAQAASIDLGAHRDGDTIRITAAAQATGDGERSPSAKLRLRLVLVEDEIRYVGGNRLRFHHHVVRAMPGGPEGKELAGGKGQLDVTVNLADVRKELEEYLSTYAKTRSFPNPLPEIALEDLSVVAFVQDDGDKAVLHAVSVPVEAAK